MSGFGTHGVELIVGAAFGYAPYATPAWTDISKYVHKIDLRRGVSPGPTPRAAAGTCVLTLDNDDSRFDPNNSASPYDPDVVLTVPVRVQAKWATVTYDLFYGYVTSWDIDYPFTGERSICRVSCSDGLQLLNQTNLIGETYETEATDDRIAAILDDAGWPAGWRSLDAGLSTAMPMSGASSALRMLNACAIADSGRIFIDASGDVVYHNRVQYAGGGSSAGTFGPADLPYASISLPYDDKYLYNDVYATRAPGGDVTIRLEAPSATVEAGGPGGTITLWAPATDEKATVSWEEVLGDPSVLSDAIEAMSAVTSVDVSVEVDRWYRSVVVVTSAVPAAVLWANPRSVLAPYMSPEAWMNPESVLSWRWDEAAVILSSEAADTVDGEEVATVFDTVVVPASVPETQHASDATSITDNRIRTLTFSGLVCNNDLEARSVAEWTVGRYKDMDTRVQQVTVKPQVDPANLWPVCLGLDLRDAVTVKTAPRGGGDGLNQVVTVEQIAHSITVDRWLVTLGCHPLSSFDTADYWIVGTSDDLGTDTILA